VFCFCLKGYFRETKEGRRRYQSKGSSRQTNQGKITTVTFTEKGI